MLCDLLLKVFVGKKKYLLYHNFIHSVFVYKETQAIQFP